MEEKDLNEIERRMNAYPLEARHDIAHLISELRRLRQLPAAKTAHASASHLYDALTGLLNAGAYGVRFAMARARATRYRKLFAVLSLDLDADSLERESSDRDSTLRQIAQRLTGCVRATDTLARIGDENFAIILEDLSQAEQAERVKQHIEETLGEIIAVSPASAGVAIRLEFYPGVQQPAHRLAS